MRNNELNIGDKVTCTDGVGRKEFGIVKSFNSHGEPFVVYHCSQDWDNYQNYAAALTDSNDLTKDWL
jgi:hypothetical protein